MDISNTSESIQELQLNSWQEFGEQVAKRHLRNNSFLYRGQGDARWKIESTLDRLERRYPQTKNYCGTNPPAFDCPPVRREMHLEAFKECVRGRRGAKPQGLTELEWWALAQHHGLATPLLDWTYSPFVALFFAFEEEAFYDPDAKKFCPPKERAVFFTPFNYIKGNGTTKTPAPVVFSVRCDLTLRLGSQNAIFVKMPKGWDLESNVRARFPRESAREDGYDRPILTKIRIADVGRLDCLKFLNKMNINRMSLFPDLDGAAKYINSLWELNFDTPLGRLPDGKGAEKKGNRC